MATQFKQDNPGCDCCGPCCRIYWQASEGTIGQLRITGAGATLIYPRTAGMSPVTSAGCGQSVFARECTNFGSWPTIRLFGPTTCSDGSLPSDFGVFRVPNEIIYNTGVGYICETGGTPYSPGTDINTGALFSLSAEVFCDAFGVAVWAAEAIMGYTIEYRRNTNCSINYLVPSESDMFDLGYSVTQRDGFGTAIIFQQVTLGTGGFTQVNSFSANTNYPLGSDGYRYWFVGASQKYVKASAAALVGLSGTLNPTYNPADITADWEVS